MIVTSWESIASDRHMRSGTDYRYMAGPTLGVRDIEASPQQAAGSFYSEEPRLRRVISESPLANPVARLRG